MKKLYTFFLILIAISSAMFAQEVKDKVKFSGLMFGDYYYNASAFDATKKDLNGFQFRRIYITTDYNISDNFSSRFRLEADQTSSSLTPGTVSSTSGKTAASDGPYLTTASLSGQKIGVMVKDAWLQWKNIFEGSNLIFGISPTPAFDVSEGAWGHRYLEKTIMDLNGTVPSRDLGIDLKGKFAESGSVKYWLKIANNSGNAPESDKYKRFYGMLEFDPSPEILITVYGDYAAYAQKTDAFDKTAKSNNAFVGAAFLNYKQKGSFSLGLEGFLKSQSNNFAVAKTSPLATQGGFGLSIWAYANLSETTQIIGRFDTFDPNTDAASTLDGKSLILAGIQFNPTKGISITPNVEVITYQATSSNGGNKSDVMPRVTFFWEF